MAIAQTYTLISNQTLGSNLYQVSFTSIPSTYTDLIITTDAIYTSNIGYAGFIGFNNGGAGTSVNGIRLVNNLPPVSQSTGGDISFAPSNQNTPTGAMHRIQVFNYASTSTFKPVLTIHNTGTTTTNNSIASVAEIAQSYQSTSAINRVDFYAANTGGFFASGSIFTLWGIKAA